MFAGVAGCAVDMPPVTPTQVERVVVTPGEYSVFVGDTVRFSGKAQDADGAPVYGVVTTWRSSDTDVAVVTSDGLVSAIGVGSVTITATVENQSGMATLRVNPVAMTNMLLSRASPLAHQEEPFVVVDGQGRLVAGWKEMNAPAGFNRVAFARSTDGGVTWTEPELLAPLVPGGRQTDPWIAVDESDRFYFTTTESVDGSPPMLRAVIRRSEDGGVSWGAPSAVYEGGVADKEMIASDRNGTLYVTFVDILPCCNLFRLFRSVDAGVTWSEVDGIDLHSFGGFSPVLATGSDGRLYLAWGLSGTSVAASFDRGETWSPEVVLSETTPFQGLNRVNFPSIAVHPSGRISVVWGDFETGDWDVMIAHSDDGINWSTPTRVDDSSNGDQWMPSIAVGADGIVHTAWYDSRSGNTNLVYARSIDRGDTWSTDVRVSTGETPGSGDVRLGAYLGIAAGGELRVADRKLDLTVWDAGVPEAGGFPAASTKRRGTFQLRRANSHFPNLGLFALLSILDLTTIILGFRQHRRFTRPLEQLVKRPAPVIIQILC